MVGSESTIGVDKIPMQTEFEHALEAGTILGKRIAKLGDLSEIMRTQSCQSLCKKSQILWGKFLSCKVEGSKKVCTMYRLVPG